MPRKFRSSEFNPTGERGRVQNRFTGEELSRRQFLNRKRRVNVEQFRTRRAVAAMDANNPLRLKRAIYDFRRKRPRIKSEAQARKSPLFGKVLNDMMSGDRERVQRAMEALDRPEEIGEYYLGGQ